MVGLGGLEPPTSRLSGVRSNLLSYRPILLVFFLPCCVRTSFVARYILRYAPRSSLVLPCLTEKILRKYIKHIVQKFCILLRKEVIQPHLPIRLPCYDFTPVIGFALGNRFPTNFGRPQLPWCDGRCVQDPGTHSPRHSDPRLLATPTSCRRVAACSPNWDRFWSFAPSHDLASLCTGHCSTCVAQNIRGMMI